MVISKGRERVLVNSMPFRPGRFGLRSSITQ